MPGARQGWRPLILLHAMLCTQVDTALAETRGAMEQGNNELKQLMEGQGEAADANMQELQVLCACGARGVEREP